MSLPISADALSQLTANQRHRQLRQPHRQRRERRRRPAPSPPRAQQAAVAPAQDPLALQRAELGGRLVRHLAGVELSPDLEPCLRRLPVRLEPPRAWHTLAAGAAQRGGAALRDALAPRRYPIPRFASLAHCGCHLACSASGRRFRARQINLFLALLFEQVPAAAALAGLPPVALSRWDLHHGHLFLAPGCGQAGQAGQAGQTGQAGQAGRGQGLGLLLHAKEYPASHPLEFDVHLGNCQAGSPLGFDAQGMRWRNILWVDGRLACLDMAAPPLQPLLMPGLELPRTVLEQDLGLPLADVNYFGELSGRKPSERLFVCVPGAD